MAEKKRSREGALCERHLAFVSHQSHLVSSCLRQARDRVQFAFLEGLFHPHEETEARKKWRPEVRLGSLSHSCGEPEGEWAKTVRSSLGGRYRIEGWWRKQVQDRRMVEERVRERLKNVSLGLER